MSYQGQSSLEVELIHKKHGHLVLMSSFDLIPNQKISQEGGKRFQEKQRQCERTKYEMSTCSIREERGELEDLAGFSNRYTLEK